MSRDDYAWLDKRLKECPFCGKKNTYCTVELQERVRDTAGNPYYKATVHCHHCGATISEQSINRESAIQFAEDKWQHRAVDE